MKKLKKADLWGKTKWLLLASTAILTLHGEAPKNSLQFYYQSYQDNNKLSVNQPYINLTKKINSRLELGAHYTLDAITAASRKPFNPKTLPTEPYSPNDSIDVDAFSSASIRWVTGNSENIYYSGLESPNSLSLDAISGASQKEKRHEWGGQLKLFFKNFLAGIKLGYSKETDYESTNAGAQGKIDLFKKNLSLALDYSRYQDKLEPIDESFRNGLIRKRYIDNIKANATQTLSPSSLGLITYNLILSNKWGSWDNSNEKMLGNVYYPVLISSSNNDAESGGSFIWESYPEEKIAQSLSLKIIQGYPTYGHDGAVHLETSIYSDNWGIQAVSAKGILKQNISSKFFVDLQYRYYYQSAAFFYRDNYFDYNLNPEHKDYLSYYTVDPGLSSFYSQLAKFRLVLLLNNFEKSISSRDFDIYLSRFEIEISKYTRSTSKDANIRLRRFEFYDKKGLEAWVFRTGVYFNY